MDAPIVGDLAPANGRANSAKQDNIRGVDGGGTVRVTGYRAPCDPPLVSGGKRVRLQEIDAGGTGGRMEEKAREKYVQEH